MCIACVYMAFVFALKTFSLSYHFVSFSVSTTFIIDRLSSIYIHMYMNCHISHTLPVRSHIFLFQSCRFSQHSADLLLPLNFNGADEMVAEKVAIVVILSSLIKILHALKWIFTVQSLLSCQQLQNVRNNSKKWKSY